MTAVAPYPTIGWRGEQTATGDPRVPVTCPWCWGARAVLERMEAGRPWEHMPIVCPNCKGRGEVLPERRRGPR